MAEKRSKLVNRTCYQIGNSEDCTVINRKFAIYIHDQDTGKPMKNEFVLISSTDNNKFKLVKKTDDEGLITDLPKGEYHCTPLGLNIGPIKD